ncbi:thiamine phosphate synthase [Clostridium amazonitimonense]|uniref:thiamine phosphate synthase n=1 Tax=Clostridium amazonitimonense TaxID=1499689 RepID=UPI0009DE07B7|nr:thiamine phosphate synthase [Clostridium amazonitimonense]
MRVIKDKKYFRENLRHIFENSIYSINGEEFSKGRSNIEIVKSIIESEVKIFQYREKKKGKREKYLECMEIRKLTKDNGVLFIVNDDIDIALAAEADGVHIGQNDIPYKAVKSIAQDMIIGLSTNNEDQALEAEKIGVDYIGVGPIFPTTTKLDAAPTAGLKYLKWVSENINIPHVAIGGIKESNILLAKENGAMSYAIISEIVGAENIKEKVKKIQDIIK